MFNKKYLGAMGEQMAEKYLKKNGYKILAKNCKFCNYEIDIVTVLPKRTQMKELKKKCNNKIEYKKSISSIQDNIVFVEVKYSSSRVYGEPFERVDVNKQKHIRAASEMFMLKNKISLPCRYDVVSIVGDEITHITNAF